MLDGASGFFASIVPAVLFFVKWIMPPIIGFVVFWTGRNAFNGIVATFFS